MNTRMHAADLLSHVRSIAALFACGAILGACAARSVIDPERNQMTVGEREGRGEDQIHRLLRERTEIYRHPELVVRYFEKMEERLAPSPIEGELVLGQVRDSADAWERFFGGTR